jgi:DNA-binding NarL/FixJ family response regulator
MVKVLLMDDEEYIAEMASEFLSMDGDIEVETVSVSMEGLKRCSAEPLPYDVIISDYQMPMMDGIQLLKKLRAEGVDAPFILFTGRGREEVVIEALNSGADFYLQKGGNPSALFGELANVVRQLHKRWRAESELEHRNEEMAILYEASDRLIGETDLSRIYEVISDSTLRLMKADNLVVSSYDDEKKMMTCEFCWNEGTRIDVSAFPPIPLEDEGKGVQSKVIRDGRPLLIKDFQAIARMSRSSYVYDEEGHIIKHEDLKPEEKDDLTKSAVVVPLKHQGRVIGVVQVLSSNLDNFTDEDVRLVESLAGHAAAAIAVAKHAEAEARETRQRRLIESRLGMLERAMDGLAEAVIVWRISAEDIIPIGFNKEAEATALNPSTLMQMKMDDMLLDPSGSSLQGRIREAAADGGILPPMAARIKMSSGEWKQAETRFCLIDREHVVLYSMGLK